MRLLLQLLSYPAEGKVKFTVSVKHSVYFFHLIMEIIALYSFNKIRVDFFLLSYRKNTLHGKDLQSLKWLD